jgi:hypothetical protein
MRDDVATDASCPTYNNTCALSDRGLLGNDDARTIHQRVLHCACACALVRPLRNSVLLVFYTS